MKNSARTGAGMLTVFHHNSPVNQNKLGANRILVRIFKGRFINYFIRVENSNVSELSFGDKTSIMNAQSASGLATHLSDCFFQAQDLSLAHI